MRDEEETGGFLARWSRRKDAVRRGEAPHAAETQERAAKGSDQPLTPESAELGGEDQAMAVAPGDQQREPTSPSEVRLTEADFADVDFNALNEASDFTRFLGPRVPELIRQKALARLWQTDPAFSTADVFHDYAEDFTDAAKAVPGIASSWQFGRGYLSDEEVAAWEALGKPPAETEAAGRAKEGADQEAGAPRHEATEPAALSAMSAGAEVPEARVDAAHADAGPVKDDAPPTAPPATPCEENAKT